jgi:hypothetical protein
MYAGTPPAYHFQAVIVLELGIFALDSHPAIFLFYG